ncbi:uncharacterized protein LOC143891234 [Tasmannia lanceolata]|uniref:uncharacterized protein LOC143891234 n=1 Tax=Tasmannia lanceolata TaxID=3420 RepID=UPI0040634D72
MASFNPLARILEDNKLSGPNYVDWKRNLTIVLRAAKVYYVLTTVTPKVPDDNATNEEKGKYNKWLEDDDMAKCYILASMTNVLQHQHQGLPTATDMMANIKEMFGEQNRTARFITMKSLVSTNMVEGTPVREQMLKIFVLLVLRLPLRLFDRLPPYSGIRALSYLDGMFQQPKIDHGFY